MSDVVMLFGGTSSERLVSVASAQHVAALFPAFERWFISPEGRVFLVDAESLASHERAFENPLTPKGSPKWSSIEEALEAVAAKGGEVPSFFLALHGGEGEDGTLQAMFEKRRLPFTGSGSDASRRCFDKSAAKAVARANGLRVAEALELPVEAPEAALRSFVAAHGRTVVKPVEGGSSIGLFHVRTEAEVAETARQVRGVRYLAEQFIEGKELTVGVVDLGKGPFSLPCSEVRLVEGGSFDYAGKYLGRGTVEVTPAEVPPALFQEAQRAVLEAHRSLGCEGYSRTDLITGRDGVVFLETNTLPGLTRASFIPQQLAAAKIPVRDFVEAQLVLARKRAART